VALEISTIFDNPEEERAEHKANIITDIKEAVRDRSRLNIFIDDKFFCSLALQQVLDFKIKIGRKLGDEELLSIKKASEFGKFYQRALEYALIRPRSVKEMNDYLKRKTLSQKARVRNRKTGEYQTVLKKGYDIGLIEPVMQRLCDRGYVDDERFAQLWIENRSTVKGISIKKLRIELKSKGVSEDIIQRCLNESPRNEREELRKVIARKSKRYSDEQKLIQYLLRQGFDYSDVIEELSALSSSE